MSDILQLTKSYGAGFTREAWLNLVQALRTLVEVRRVIANHKSGVVKNRVIKLITHPPDAYVTDYASDGADAYSFVTCQDIPDNEDVPLNRRGIARFNGEVDIELDTTSLVAPETGGFALVSANDGSLGTTDTAAGGALIGRIIDASQYNAMTHPFVTIVLRFNCAAR